MPKKSKISPDEIKLFEDAMHEAKPLKLKKKIRLKRNIVSKIIIQDNKTENFLSLNESESLIEVKGEDFLLYQHPSISSKIVRRLRKGHYPIDASLDLHRLTVNEAREAIIEFIEECMQRQARVVLIIHGKGVHNDKPILKNKLNHWLRGLNVVLAFCSAATPHGSRGAMYVLLKRKTEESSV